VSVLISNFLSNYFYKSLLHSESGSINDPIPITWPVKKL